MTLWSLESASYILGVRLDNIEANLKLLAKNNRKYRKVIIHIGTHDTRLHQLEVTKIESVCNNAKSMSDSIVFSGPLPNSTSNMFSHMSSLRGWMPW